MTKKPIEDRFQFFLQEQSDELFPSTEEYRKAQQEADNAREKVVKSAPIDFQDAVNDALHEFEEELTHCTNIQKEYIYTIAFKDAFRILLFLLGNTYNPLKPADFY